MTNLNVLSAQNLFIDLLNTALNPIREKFLPKYE